MAIISPALVTPIGLEATNLITPKKSRNGWAEWVTYSPFRLSFWILGLLVSNRGAAGAAHCAAGPAGFET